MTDSMASPSIPWEQFIEAGLDRGWHLKEAKWGRRGTASLLSHSLTVAGITEQLLRAMKRAENEVRIGVATAFLHDFLKESHSSREAIEREGRLRDKEFTKEDFETIARLLETAGYSKEEIMSVQSILPHGALQSLDHLATILRVAPREDTPLVRRVVHDVADPLASIRNFAEFNRSRRRLDDLLEEWGLRLEYHQVSKIRGILTSLCHRAIEECYSECGFKPILYYPDGTIYVGKRGDTIDGEQFRRSFVEKYWSMLEDYIAEVPEGNVARAIHGVHTQTKIPSPQFAYASDSILDILWERIRKSRVVSDPQRDQIGKYIESAERLKREGVLDIDPDEDAIKELYGIFIIFYYLKEICTQACGDSNWLTSIATNEAVASLQKEYESAGYSDALGFPEFLEIVGKQSHSGSGVDEKIIEGSSRLRRLIPEDLTRSDVLDRSADICRRLSRVLRPFAEKRVGLRSNDIPGLIASEIVHPLADDPTRKIREISDVYIEGKKRGGTVVCPICGDRPTLEIKSQKVGDGEAKSFTNFLIGGATLQNRTVCTLCDLEMSLRSLRIGEGDVYEYYLIPQLNLSRNQMDLWARRIDEFVTVRAYGEEPLRRDDAWARKIDGEGISSLNEQSTAIAENLFRDDKRLQKALKRRLDGIIGEFDGSFGEFRRTLNVAENDPDSLIDAILKGVPISPELRERLMEEGEIGALFSLITPNYILISFPVPNYEKGDHKASNALRHLFRGSILSRIFFASVIVKELKFEPLCDIQADGAVMIPTDLHFSRAFRPTGIELQNGWLSLKDTDRALEKISAIILVAESIRAAEHSKQSRKGEFMTILKEPKGRTLNRIVQGQKSRVLPASRLFEQLDRIFS